MDDESFPATSSDEAAPDECPPIAVPAGDVVVSLAEGRLSVFLLRGRPHVVGAEVADLFGKQTFNLYRSLKLRGVGCHHCGASFVRRLIGAGVLSPAVHSATLLSLDEFLDRWYLSPDHRGREGEPHVVASRGLARLYRRKRPRWLVRRSARAGGVVWLPAAAISPSGSSRLGGEGGEEGGEEGDGAGRAAGRGWVETEPPPAPADSAAQRA